MKFNLLILLIFTFYITSAQVQYGQTIQATHGEDQCGYSVSISGDGNTLAVGAPSNIGYGKYNLMGLGQTRIYRLTNDSLVQIGRDIYGPEGNSLSGMSVSLSEDGSVVAIGEPGFGWLGFGQVRVFALSGDKWTQLGPTILGKDYDTSYWFGQSISISGNGRAIAIGGKEMVDQNPPYEKVYSTPTRVFTYAAGNWVQIGDDITFNGGNGSSDFIVELSKDGNILAIGADRNDENGLLTGRVRVYQLKNNNWVKSGQDLIGDSLSLFGSSLSLSSEGKILAVGAPGQFNNRVRTGQVTIYEYEDQSWSQIGLVSGSEVSQCGQSVSLSSSGSRLAVGFPHLSNSQNHAYVSLYEFDGDNFVQIGDRIHSSTYGDGYGWSVSLSSDGSRVAFGTPFELDSSGRWAWGKAQVFSFDGVTLNINEAKHTMDINVYPNPVSNVLYINADWPEQYDIMDVRGHVVMSEIFQDQSLDLSSLSEGLYTLVLRANNSYHTLKFLKL